MCEQKGAKKITQGGDLSERKHLSQRKVLLERGEAAASQERLKSLAREKIPQRLEEVNHRSLS